MSICVIIEDAFLFLTNDFLQLHKAALYLVKLNQKHFAKVCTFNTTENECFEGNQQEKCRANIQRDPQVFANKEI